VVEIIKMINILLGSQSVITCPQADTDGNNAVTVDEIYQAINNVLAGCGSGAVTLSTESLAAAAAQTVTLQIGSASGARGQGVVIPVILTGGGGMVAGAQLDMIFDTAVFASPTCAKHSRLTNHSLSTSLPMSPPVPAGKTRQRSLLADTNSASAFTDGRLFACIFPIKTTAPTGTFTILGSRQRVSDSPGNEVPSIVTNGSVTVF
jgi:hypothetical protein